MSVLLETSVGEIVIDLFISEGDAPIASMNFLKLCKMKYYNGCLFFNIQPNLIAQTGDPTGTGTGGNSIFGILENNSRRFFKDEINGPPFKRKFNKVGLVAMANFGENSNRSQFFFTLRGEEMSHFDGKYTIFGEVAEGLEALETLNSLYCDGDGRPFQDVRIRHTFVLEDPFPDPVNLIPPNSSPVSYRPSEEIVQRRIAYEDGLEESTTGMTEAELEESIRRKEAQSRAIVLEMTGDLPDADVKPPEEVLFVAKLNPVTRDEDLEIIFSRFGKVLKCEIIRDHKTGDSLNYAFIEYETEASCIEAYKKMNNVLIDDRRIKVDFSQSVSKLWNKFLMRPQKGFTKKSGSKSSIEVPLEKSRKLPTTVEAHASDSCRGRDSARGDERQRDRRRSKSRSRSRSRSRVKSHDSKIRRDSYSSSRREGNYYSRRSHSRERVRHDDRDRDRDLGRDRDDDINRRGRDGERRHESRR